MIAAFAAALVCAILAFTFLVRPQQLREEAAVSPWQHLEGRKSSIYENLRDLQFEYRLGKLSDDDYQRTKNELQSELAKVLAEIDTLKTSVPVSGITQKSPGRKSKAAPYQCSSCGARFEKALRFCGECGKPMGAQA